MKLPLILASDFFGFTESLFLGYSFWVLLPLSLIALLLSFAVEFKRAARIFAWISVFILSLQLLALLSYLAMVTSPWDELGSLWCLILPVIITIIALIRSRKTKHHHAQESSND